MDKEDLIMIKCKYCGSENPDDTTFCMNCGAAIIPEDESRVETETTKEGETILEAYQPEMNYTSSVPSDKPDYQTVCLLALIFGIVGFFFNPLYLVSLTALILGIIGHINMGTKKKEYLSFQVADRFYKVNLDDIVYLESMGRDTHVVTKTETICGHAKFSDMEQQVPADRFIRCHRSYIINLTEVKDIARYRFLTKNGIEIPISQLQYTDVKKDFIEYY